MRKTTPKEVAKARKKKQQKISKKKQNLKRSEERLKRIKSRKVSKIKQEYLDIDYMSQLSKKDQLWMADFLAESLNAEIPAYKDAKETRFHKSKKQVKKVSDANNARQRDEFGQKKAQGRLMYLSNENMSVWFDSRIQNQKNDTEDDLIDLLDRKRAMEKREIPEED